VQPSANGAPDAFYGHTSQNGQEASRSRLTQTIRNRLHQTCLVQEFRVDAPYEVWTSDITYLRTDSGWQYLTVIMELFNREIIGYSLSNRLTTETTVTPALDIGGSASPTTRRGYSALESWRTVCQQGIQKKTQKAQHDPKHERQRQLLRQCRDGDFFQNPENRMDLRQKTPEQTKASPKPVCVHRDLLQPEKDSLGIRLSVAG
jgi:hypothetical protein